MSACCCRGCIENGKGNFDAESVQDRMIQWVERFNLVEQLGTFEWDAIRSPLGSLPSVVANRMSWDAEGLAVLVWALGRGKLPEHDGQVDPYAVTDSVNFLGDDANDIIASASLLGAEELNAYRELMYAIHCRVRDFLRGGQRKDFTSWVEMRWFDALRLDSNRFIVDGDLGVDGKTIDIVELERLKTCEWGICEQHRASIWLVGEEQNHWETAADT